MIITYGANSVTAASLTGYARVFVTNGAAHSLEGVGDPGCLRAVCKRAEALCLGDTFVCVVEDSNPLRDKLMKLYERLGFKNVGRILKREI